MKKIYLKLGQWLFKKPFVEGESFCYTLNWAVEEGARFYKLYFGWDGAMRASVGAMDDEDVKEYKDGERLEIFASEEDALEGGRRVQEALKKYHEELGY